MRVVYHPEAEKELIGAAQFYELRIAALGVKLLDAVDRSISVIVEDPLRCSIIEQNVRRFLLPTFPYAIYYSVWPEYIRILAFKHHSRHPDYWRERLED